MISETTKQERLITSRHLTLAWATTLTIDFSRQYVFTFIAILMQAWHDCSAPIWKGTLLSKHSCQLLLFRLEWEDVNFNWIGKQTLMPVQIGAATHKQPSNPSNMITQEFWANQNQSSNFRFLIFMKYNGFILTCCKQYALESYFSQHGKHWRKHHRGWGSGGGSLQVVKLQTKWLIT